MKISPAAQNAIRIGMLCSVSYLAVYIARNILGAVTPQMVEDGFRESFIGQVSSLYFICYALGQLVNGAIGDKIKAKWMISMGLSGAGIMNLLFSLYAATPAAAMVTYACNGIFLSMIYGPMTKVVSENTEPLHATRCSLGYTFASFFGSPAAGLLASFLPWQWVFHVSSIVLFLMSLVAVCTFSLFEKQGIVKYGQYKAKKGPRGNLSMLFKHHIVKFSLIAILTGVVRTSVVFWLPTYLVQYLDFSPKAASVIFTVASLVISATSFIAVFIYEKLGYNMDETILLFFSTASIFLFLTYFIAPPAINISCLVLAILSSNGVTCMMWNRYCPSLRDTGMVSSVTGFLDFLSYMAAAVANLVFADAVTAIGWGNLILVWLGLMIIGVVVALPHTEKKA